MAENLEDAILSKLSRSGWAAMRAFLQDPSQEPNQDEIAKIEEAMKGLARKGSVTLWRLAYKYEPIQMMAVSKPDLELDKELEQRGAWATAERLEGD